MKAQWRKMVHRPDAYLHHKAESYLRQGQHGTIRQVYDKQQVGFAAISERASFMTTIEMIAALCSLPYRSNLHAMIQFAKAHICHVPLAVVLYLSKIMSD